MSDVLNLSGLRTLAVAPAGECRKIVIFLHGYAMRPEDLSPFAASMRTDAMFYFPQGPESAEPQGFAWWPIDGERRLHELQRGPRDLAHEYPESRPAVRERLRFLIENVRSRHESLPIVLAGFSQGGMLACDTALHENVNLSALVLMSTSRIAIRDWTPRLHKIRGLPVFISHGQGDADLAFSAGERLRDCLLVGGASITWTPHDGSHEIPLIVWRELRRFVNSLSSSNPPPTVTA